MNANTDKYDLVKFIKQESLREKLQADEVVIEMYACALWKGFFDLKHKLHTTPNLNYIRAVNMGITLVDNLFWILFHYSSTLQLTLFLTERGRLLYTEFLTMSRTHKLMKKLNAFPSIHDGFHFAVKKSIGSLTCKEHHTKMMFHNILKYRATFRKIFETLNTKYLVKSTDTQWNDDQINITLHNLNHKISLYPNFEIKIL